MGKILRVDVGRLLIVGKTQLNLMSVCPIPGRSYPRVRFNRSLIQTLPIICMNIVATEQAEAIAMALVRHECMTHVSHEAMLLYSYLSP